MSLEAYLREHRLESILSDTLNQCTKARVHDPLVFMSKHLLNQTSLRILDCKARYVFDSRGLPTTEVEITTARGVSRATCPASSFQTLSEFREYRDDDPDKYKGCGVMRAVYEINEKIAPKVIGQDAQQNDIDSMLVKNTSYVNVMYPVSVAVYKAGSVECHATRLPLPVVRVCTTRSFQRLYVLPVREPNIDSLRRCVEVYHRIGNARTVDTVVEGLVQVTKAIHDCRHVGKLKILVDMNASEFLTEDNHYEIDGMKMTRDEMHAMYKKWTTEYPVAWIENPFDHEEAFEGRDYYVSSHPAQPSSLFSLKPSRYGTVTRVLEACRSFGNIMVSARTGDTDDDFEMRLAIEIGATYLRFDSIPRFNAYLRK